MALSSLHSPALNYGIGTLTALREALHLAASFTPEQAKATMDKVLGVMDGMASAFNLTAVHTLIAEVKATIDGADNTLAGIHAVLAWLDSVVPA